MRWATGRPGDSTDLEDSSYNVSCRTVYHNLQLVWHFTVVIMSDPVGSVVIMSDPVGSDPVGSVGSLLPNSRATSEAAPVPVVSVDSSSLQLRLRPSGLSRPSGPSSQPLPGQPSGSPTLRQVGADLRKARRTKMQDSLALRPIPLSGKTPAHRSRTRLRADL